MKYKKFLSSLVLVGLLAGSSLQCEGTKIFRKIPKISFVSPLMIAAGMWLAWDGIDILREKYKNKKTTKKNKNITALDAIVEIAVGAIFSAMGAVCAYILVRSYKLRDKPIVICGEDGITVEGKGLFKQRPDRTYFWDAIKKITKIKEYENGIKQTTKFKFKTDDSVFVVNMNELNIKVDEFEELLREGYE